MNRYYPDLSKTEKSDHLLFDLGFSYALLYRSQEVLKGLLPTTEAQSLRRKEIVDLLDDIDELHKGRLQIRSELYDNAAAAAKKGTAK